MHLPFKTKALLLFCSIIIAISLAYTLMAIRVEQKLLREEIIKRGEILATIAAKSAELPLLSENAELVHMAAESLIEIKNVPFVTFYSRDFNMIVHKGVSISPQPQKQKTPENEAFVQEHTDYFEFYNPVFSVRSDHDINLFEEMPSADSEIKDHIGWVRIGLSKEVMQQTTKQIVINGFMFAMLMVAIAVVLVNVILNESLKPLNVLFTAVKDLQEGEYPQVPNIEGGGEIGQLSAEFNKMSHAIKDREQQLMYSQQRIRDLFERVDHAIFRLDSNFKVIEGNKRFAELCEHDADFFCLVPEEERDSLLKTAIAGELVDAEVVITGRDGQRHTIFLSVYPETGADGSIAGFDGHFVDMSEKKKLEEALHQTQKLESLGLLAGGIAHDFNNILTAIIGYSEIALLTLSKDDPMRRRMEAIYAAGEKASALTRQLLAFSRKQLMEIKVINLNSLIQNIMKMLGRLIGENIEMKLNLKEQIGNIKADPGQIEQIIMNLTVNARDAMPNGGSLTFETDTVELDDEYCRTHADVTPGFYTELCVADTGYGLTPEVKEKMFDPFFTTKEKGKGTGLGLSTVYGIVKQLKGHLFVYSEIGHGTSFKIYFPVVIEDAEEMMAKERQAMEQGTDTILVVDDDASIRNLITDTMRPLGYNVLTADSGENALDISQANAGRIDLLLSDVIMPGMNGRELADRLSNARPEIKVILMSGYTDDVISDKGILRPEFHFINKPLIPSVLARRIREILDHE